MKSNLELVDLVWDAINVSALKAAVTGGLYRFKRPAGSIKEDIVINSLPVTNDDLQRAVINVNVHVPNKVINNGNIQDTKQPDTLRLHALAELAKQVIKETWFDSGNFDLQQQSLFEDDTESNHYLNYRIQFFVENI